MVILSFDGNIGASKSTLLNDLKEYSHIKTIPEPIKEWTLSGVLKKMYHHPKKSQGI